MRHGFARRAENAGAIEKKKVLTITTMIVALAGPSFAGGLDAPMIEADPIIVEEDTGGIGQAAVVIGVAGLLLAGALIAGGDDDDDGDDAGGGDSGGGT